MSSPNHPIETVQPIKPVVKLSKEERPTHPPLVPPIHRPTNPPLTPPINRPTNPPLTPPVDRPTHPPLKPPLKPGQQPG
jgi:hypothetical protein